MWRRVKNFVKSLITYQTLSPDGRIRQKVNQKLKKRPYLSVDEWFKLFWEPEHILDTTVEFVYNTFSDYSGLLFSHVLPSDRFEEDLCWTTVCWFDWELDFFDDVNARFSIDISDRFQNATFVTVAELMKFLDQQIRQSENNNTVNVVDAL